MGKLTLDMQNKFIEIKRPIQKFNNQNPINFNEN